MTAMEGSNYCQLHQPRDSATPKSTGRKKVKMVKKAAKKKTKKTIAKKK